MAGASPVHHPSALVPGTVVGPWRVVEWAGGGTQGAVYRAVQVDKEQAAAVALKLALKPGNPRFEREVELLSRMRHASIPRLWDAGEWRSPRGEVHPYLVMEWIDGAPLYSWAEQSPPSAQQVLRWLAELTRALQVVHSQGAVHRDVKGANVWVRRSDGRAMLIDFGSGVYPDAAVLTAPDMYPGTPAYRSPESGLFELQSLRQRTARYRAGPADDLFALGVTACRLLSGEYPSFSEPEQDEQGLWRLESVHTPVALQRVEPVLREWVLRLLSVRPEERGTAAQLAEALEQASQPAPRRRPAAASPEVENSGAERGAGGTISAENGRPQVEARRWLWLAVGSGLTLATWMVWTVATKLVEKLASAHVMEARSSQADGGTAGLGEAVASVMDSPEPSHQEALAEETPPEPLPGQTVPDAKGHCPHRNQVALNGACWVPLEYEECDAFGNGQRFRGKCYLPVLLPHRPATTSPKHKP